MSPIDPMRLERIAAMAAEGMSDRQIADELNTTRDAVSQYRKRYGIPPGVQPTRPGTPSPSKDTIAARAESRTRRTSRQYVAMDDDAYARRACRHTDPELFFVPDGWRGPARTERERQAKAICATCPVAAACLEVALTNGEAYGVYGGTTEDERAAIARRRRQRKGAAA